MNFLVIILSLFMSGNVFSNVFPSSSLKGFNSDGDRVHFMVKKVPGRKGSFYGLLSQKKHRSMKLYLLDQLNKTTFTMNPLSIMKDGLIGIQNDDPSNILIISTGRGGKFVASITKANSSNLLGEEKVITFKGKKSKSQWIGFKEGIFENEGDDRALQLSQFDEVERESIAVFATEEISGNYKISERLPGMFLINAFSVKATGVGLIKTPKAIGVFIFNNDCGLFCKNKTQLVLIDSSYRNKLSFFNRK